VLNYIIILMINRDREIVHIIDEGIALTYNISTIHGTKNQQI